MERIYYMTAPVESGVPPPWIKCTNISAEKHKTTHTLQKKNAKITNSFLSGLPPAEVRACKVRFLPYNFPANSAVLRGLGFCNCRQKGIDPTVQAASLVLPF